MTRRLVGKMQAHVRVKTEMSGYFQALGETEKVRYTEKLTWVGLSLQDDRYLPENAGKFVSGMSTWPQIEYGHIFSYFISRPGVYTQEQLPSCKHVGYLQLFSSRL